MARLFAHETGRFSGYLPERGRPAITPGTRELVSCWPYVIVYRITGSTVEILNIWHSAQDR
ncbi:type II toxin-antitoxin system RelE/ParE family toxin [Brytella acorum]|uniref:type II toxin-antitoxin system RelE/ParE family toxin n=1 Tax=Brytella acorum TaxID=2959299 RepID=UPI0025ADA75D|nr:type II toxin-antitoxin system RelE/ParE family toxin [Brytella acorum]MDF3626249.1 type II toxin-antitoxin system RelE/ParE family toxin [Brytella acorum]